MIWKTTLLLLSAMASMEASCLTIENQEICTPVIPTSATTSNKFTRLDGGLDSFVTPEKPKSKWFTPYRASQLAVIGGMTADIVSSWGCAEANPILRSADGRFYGKGLAIKVGVTSGALLITHLLKRKYPKFEKPLAFMLGGTSGFLYATAIRNYSMPCY